MVNSPEGATKLNWCWRSIGFEKWPEQSIMELGVEDGDANPFGRERVVVRAWAAFDQSMEAEATQVVAHLRRAVVHTEESGDMQYVQHSAVITGLLNPGNSVAYWLFGRR